VEDARRLQAVDDLAPLIVGEGAGRIEHVLQRMIRHSFWLHGPISLSALSGIEHALWDIFGKSLGKPVYQSQRAIPLGSMQPAE
jgi:galactonate dehydratase